MSKIYTPGMRPVRYTGEYPYIVRELKYARFESVVTLEKGDIVFLPLLTAVTLLKRKHRIFEAVTDLVLEGTVCVPEDIPSEESLENVQIDANLSAPIDLNDIDTAGLLNPVDDEEATVEEEEQASYGDAEAVEEDAAADTSMDTVVITKENIMDESVVSLEMIKEACKLHSITIGRKNRGDLTALLLAYL